MQPPPPSRHRGILHLQKSTPLLDMRFHPVNNLQELFTTSKDATPTLMVDTIVTFCAFPTSRPGFDEISVKFYGCDEIFECRLAVPSDWSPKLLLATIDASIMKQKMIVLDYPTILGMTTINDIFYTFHWPTQIVKEKFSAFHVCGGIFL